MTFEEKAADAKYFWGLARLHAAARIAYGTAHPTAVEARDDLDVMAMYLEWPLLKARAQAIVDHPEPVYITRVSASG